MSGLMTNFWFSSVTSSKNLLHAAFDHLFDDGFGLARFCGPARSGRPFSRSTSEGPDRLPTARPDLSPRYASRSDDRFPAPCPRDRSARPEHRSCPCLPRPHCGRSETMVSPSSTCNRRRVMFSPMRAMASVRTSSTGRLFRWVWRRTSTSSSTVRATSAMSRTSCWKVGVLGDKIGFRVQLDRDARCRY